MEGPLSISWGRSGTRAMIEQAKEELQILESQHPSRFNYLKLELKSFISLLESHSLSIVNTRANSTSISISSSATTQASSTSKKRKKKDEFENDEQVREDNGDGTKLKCWRLESDGFIERRDRIDVVLERAQACLRKIQLFKTSF